MTWQNHTHAHSCVTNTLKLRHSRLVEIGYCFSRCVAAVRVARFSSGGLCSCTFIYRSKRMSVEA